MPSGSRLRWSTKCFTTSAFVWFPAAAIFGQLATTLLKSDFVTCDQSAQADRSVRSLILTIAEERFHLDSTNAAAGDVAADFESLAATLSDSEPRFVIFCVDPDDAAAGGDSPESPQLEVLPLGRYCADIASDAATIFLTSPASYSQMPGGDDDLELFDDLS